MNRNIIVLDTETANSLEEPIAYDIGFAVVDTENGDILEEHSFAIAEIFLDKELMNSAYYKEKIPQYWEEIKKGTRKLVKFETAHRILYQTIKKYNVNVVAAHNARFDNRSTNLSRRYLTSSKNRFFFPYGVEIWDTLKMAREVMKGNEDYTRFCIENNYMTKKNQKRFTAEILYRYLTGNNDFEEEHRGIDDVRIEKEIFMYCLGVNPEIDGRLWK